MGQFRSRPMEPLTEAVKLTWWRGNLHSGTKMKQNVAKDDDVAKFNGSNQLNEIKGKEKRAAWLLANYTSKPQPYHIKLRQKRGEELLKPKFEDKWKDKVKRKHWYIRLWQSLDSTYLQLSGEQKINKWKWPNLFHKQTY